MRAVSAANRVGLRQFEHSGLNVCDGHRPNDTATLIANEIRLAFTCADYQATAAVHVRDIFVWHDGEALEC